MSEGTGPNGGAFGAHGRVESETPEMPGARINVVGPSCAGKTTMSSALARALNLVHVEMDALYHGPDWTPTPLPVLRARVREITSGDRWVVDGNYGSVRDAFWARADTVIWLDYGLPVVMARMLRRTSRRIALHERLWNDNREDLRTWLLSRDSLLLYTLGTFASRRRELRSLLSAPTSAHLTVVHLGDTRMAETWLTAVLAHSAERKG